MVGVFFGGASVEHEISVLTGLTAYGFLEGDKIAVYMDKAGRWWSGRGPSTLAWYRKGKPARQAEEVCMLPGQPVLYHKRGNRLRPLCQLDCALLCNHGRQGEDGCLQGFLELCGLPYTSAGVTASAVGMDKAVCKTLLSGKIPQLPFVVLYQKSWQQALPQALKLGFPLIVKPARLGSSVGIGVAEDKEQLLNALNTAFGFDDKVVLEPALQNFREYNCSAFACGGQVLISGLEQPLRSHEILSYADKYQKGGYKFSQRPAPADEAFKPEIGELTQKIYGLLELQGVVRADFLVQDGKIYFNEVNTVPGSLAYYFWEKEGLPPQKLLRLLIDEAVQSAEAAKTLCRSLETDILDTAGLNSCKK